MKSLTKFYLVNQMIFHMWSNSQSLKILACECERSSYIQSCKDLTRKTNFLEGWFLQILQQCSKGLRLKITRFWGLSPTFGEVTGKIWTGGLFALLPSSWIGLTNYQNKPGFNSVYWKKIFTKICENWNTCDKSWRFWKIWNTLSGFLQLEVWLYLFFYFLH